MKSKKKKKTFLVKLESLGTNLWNSFSKQIGNKKSFSLGKVWKIFLIKLGWNFFL